LVNISKNGRIYETIINNILRIRKKVLIIRIRIKNIIRIIIKLRIKIIIINQIRNYYIRLK
jgi:hypothetical protein